MLLNTRRIASRCLPRATMHVATAFIAPDGGRMNITSKIFATIWYLLILPDSRTSLNRHVTRKRIPWYAPSRLIGIVMSAGNVLSMPASWILLFAGKRNASRLASLAVLANRPSLTISALLFNEFASQLLKLSSSVVASTGNLLSKPIQFIMPNSNNNEAEQPTTPTTTTTITTTAAAAAAATTTPTPTVTETPAIDTSSVVSDAPAQTTPAAPTTSTTTTSAVAAPTFKPT